MGGLEALLKGLDWASLGPYGILLCAFIYIIKLIGPQLGALVMSRVERSDQFLANTIDRLFKHADEDRALFVDQMTSLKTHVALELEKERVFHAAALRDQRTMWESILNGRKKNEDRGSSDS